MYLVTASRILASTADATGLQDPSAITRAQFLEHLRDAIQNPVIAATGRPRERGPPQLLKIAVFREYHKDGSVHLHAAVKLSGQERFAGMKAAMRQRHNLATHWSCSHAQFWSAVRYGTIGNSLKKDVDKDPVTWCADGKAMDLFYESQEPFNASAMRLRREKADKEAAAASSKQTFTKLDFTSLVISRSLQTTAQALSFIQEGGTTQMQMFACKHQRKLGEFIEDAWEWDAAAANAREEALTDWEIAARATHSFGNRPTSELRFQRQA